MKHYLIALLLLILSCSNRKTENLTKQAFEKDSFLKKEIVSRLEIESIADTTNSNFQQFWDNFREAVINNDTSKIIQLTRFPFETRGPQDSDPIIKYEKKKFLKVLEAYLKETTTWREDFSTITSREEIKRILKPDKTYVQGDWARIGNLEFKKENGKWFLIFAYLGYPSIEGLNKE